jgi:hypothetical protein
MLDSVIFLDSEPGIQRDGTQLNSKSYVDGQWVRFYDGKPLKIGGYRMIDTGSNAIIRTIFNYDNQIRPNSADVYIGRHNFVGYINFNLNGVSTSGEVNRTPANYIADNSNLWSFDVFSNTTSPENPSIVAHVAPNANDSSNTTQGPIYYGNATDDLPFTNVLDDSGNPVLVSGGIVFLPPLLIAYDNNGLIRWCNPGILSGPGSGWSTNRQNIANNKIIKILISRGSSGPQLLAWTSNSIISLTLLTDQDGNISFNAVTIDNRITVMSPLSIVGFNSQFFWIGDKKFYYFNGIVRTLKNKTNSQFFFQSVNLSQRSKVFAQIIEPGTGDTELWFHFPRISADSPNPIENTHAVVFNTDPEKNFWFDCKIARTAAAQGGIFPLPIMADSNLVNNNYPLWMHETGVDKIFALPTNPPTPIPPGQIVSIYFSCETHLLNFFEGNPNNNRAMRITRIEPDARMNGSMNITVRNRFFPFDIPIDNGPYTFDLNTKKIDAVNSQGRLSSFKLESDEIGADFHMGKMLLNYNVGDVRSSGPGKST